jgi:hypothetical protein
MQRVNQTDTQTADRQKDLKMYGENKEKKKRIVEFRNFSKAPKNANFLEL